MPAPTHTIRKPKGKGRAAAPEKVTPTMPLGKQLAHTDKAVRDGAVQGLVAFVSKGTYVDEDAGESSTGYVPLSEVEMAKLWKGLFYCFWMSDKPLVQQSLASDLAEILLLINPTTTTATGVTGEGERLVAALGLLRGFWTAIIREWTGLDRLRMDKFYLLMRRYVSATFRLVARHQWSTAAIDGVNEILSASSGPMTWSDKSVPSSIATHLSDIYLEELNKVLALPEVTSQFACPLIPLLGPHITLLARTSTSTVHTRLMSSLFTPLLSALSLASPDIERPAKRYRIDEPVYPHIIMGCCLGSHGVDTRASPEKLRAGLLKNMFNAAADSDANETDRRKIYKVWKEQGGDDDDDDDDE